MEISENLPQFESSPTILLVTAKQRALIYLANDGEINELSKIEVEKPTYSDREGHFEKRGSGETFGSGSVYEEKGDKVRADFLEKLKEEIEGISEIKSSEAVVFFTPSEHKNDTRSHLPAFVTDKIVMEVEGNHVDSHPTELLEKVKDEQSQ